MATLSKIGRQDNVNLRKICNITYGSKMDEEMDQCGSFVVQDLAIIGYIYFV